MGDQKLEVSLMGVANGQMTEANKKHVRAHPRRSGTKQTAMWSFSEHL